MSNDSSKHIQVDGIEFWPTQSRFQNAVTENLAGELIPYKILQRAFTFEDSTTDSSAIPGQYLSVKLNHASSSALIPGEYISNGNIIAQNNNCIIVSGMAAREAGGVVPSNSIGEDVIRFEHVFLTNFQRGSIGGYYPHYIWDFEDQTVITSNTDNWNPTGEAEGWANGGDAVNGSNWEGSTTVYGFGCKSSNPGSPGTGPNGGMGGPFGGPGFVVVPTNGLKYIYTEASSNRYEGQFVARLPGINFSQIMSSTSNDLWLDFYFHNYSSQSTTNDNMKVRVYVSTSSTSNHSSATLIHTTHPVQQMDSSGARYEEINGNTKISLNDYRTINSDHYIYVVAEGGESFRSDLALDYFQILESNYLRTIYETTFSQQVAQGSNGTLIISNSVDWVSANVTDDREDPTINFRLHARDDDNGNPCDLYVKGTYLLM